MLQCKKPCSLSANKLLQSETKLTEGRKLKRVQRLSQNPNTLQHTGHTARKSEDVSFQVWSFSSYWIFWTPKSMAAGHTGNKAPWVWTSDVLSLKYKKLWTSFIYMHVTACRHSHEIFATGEKKSCTIAASLSGISNKAAWSGGCCLLKPSGYLSKRDCCTDLVSFTNWWSMAAIPDQ